MFSKISNWGTIWSVFLFIFVYVIPHILGTYQTNYIFKGLMLGCKQVELCPILKVYDYHLILFQTQVEFNLIAKLEYMFKFSLLLNKLKLQACS